jgi:hypothetical protein
MEGLKSNSNQHLFTFYYTEFRHQPILFSLVNYACDNILLHETANPFAPAIWSYPHVSHLLDYQIRES